MARFIFISIFFLAMILMASFTASAATNKPSSLKMSITKDNGPAAASEPMPLFPATRTIPPVSSEEKAHTPKVEELPHIHHFHKERVKKAKRHHKKYWAFSKIILILCHIALLVMAYIHTAPH
jgi:hypothetical protein